MLKLMKFIIRNFIKKENLADNCNSKKSTLRSHRLHIDSTITVDLCGLNVEFMWSLCGLIYFLEIEN